MLTKSLLTFGNSLKKYGKRVLEWLKAICGEAKSSPRSRWHSRGQRFDPAYLHQSGTVIIKLSDRKILKSYDFRIFSLLFLLKLFRLFWCLFGPCNRGCACNRPYQNLTRITMILQSLLCFYGHPDLFRRMHHQRPQLHSI